MVFVHLRVLVVLLFSVSLPFLVLLREDSSKISPLWLSLLLPLRLLPASRAILSCQTSLPVLSQTVGHLGSTISNKSSPSTAGTLLNKDSTSAFPSRARRSFISSPFPPLLGKGQSLPSRWLSKIGLPPPSGWISTAPSSRPPNRARTKGLEPSAKRCSMRHGCRTQPWQQQT